jgi:hypothetical protein
MKNRFDDKQVRINNYTGGVCFSEKRICA